MAPVTEGVTKGSYRHTFSAAILSSRTRKHGHFKGMTERVSSSVFLRKNEMSLVKHSASPQIFHFLDHTEWGVYWTGCFPGRGMVYVVLSVEYILRIAAPTQSLPGA